MEQLALHKVNGRELLRTAPQLMHIGAVTLLAGDLGTCIWNAVVAVHTFMTIVLRRSVPRMVVVILLVAGWSIVILLCKSTYTLLMWDFTGCVTLTLEQQLSDHSHWKRMRRDPSTASRVSVQFLAAEMLTWRIDEWCFITNAYATVRLARLSCCASARDALASLPVDRDRNV